MKKFKVQYDDISETGYYSSGTIDYGIILAENSEEARKMVAEQIVTNGMIMLYGIDIRKNFGDRLTVWEIESEA